MTKSSAKSRAYKEVTLQQLRSFCETARLGSLSAAAQSLGIAQPTVWAQVHALERHFGTALVENSGRGCQLTDAGRVLAGLAAPSVAGIAQMKKRFTEARAEVETNLVVATTMRLLIEDLPDCVAEFSRRFPHVRLTLKDMTIDEVSAAVESGQADIGLTVPWPGTPRPLLVYEPAYDLDVLLITPKDHPLARQRQITPDDLRKYPFVNGPGAFKDPAVAAVIEKLGLLQTANRRVEAFYVPAIRHYVAMGFGIGLVSGRAGNPPVGDGLAAPLHERSMSRYFGKVTIYLVWRRRAGEEEPAGAFAAIVRSMLNVPATAGRKNSRKDTKAQRI